MSHAFTDRFGKTWNVDLNLGTVQEIEDYDFAGKVAPIKMIPPQPDLFTEQINNSKVIFGMVWVCCRDQIRDFNAHMALSDMEDLPLEDPRRDSLRPILNELDFAKRMDGVSALAMKEALWAELPGFFREAATSLKNLMGRYSKIQEKAAARIGTSLDRNLDKLLSDEKIDQMIEKEVQEMEAKVEEAMRTTTASTNAT